MTKRSITEGCNNTAGSGPRPTEAPNVARRAHDHNSALARAGLAGATTATTVRANTPAASGIDRGW